jgi:hypothetical protein
MQDSKKLVSSQLFFLYNKQNELATFIHEKQIEMTNLNSIIYNKQKELESIIHSLKNEEQEKNIENFKERFMQDEHDLNNLHEEKIQKPTYLNVVSKSIIKYSENCNILNNFDQTYVLDETQNLLNYENIIQHIGTHENPTKVYQQNKPQQPHQQPHQPHQLNQQHHYKVENEYKPLFQRSCRVCGTNPKLSTCKNFKKCHVEDKNFDFCSLPYKARCMRKVCMDLACNRRHHDLTQRIAVQCKQENCKCPHYVHVGDTQEGQPFFWAPFDQCIPKPSKELIDSYFLLKKK